MIKFFPMLFLMACASVDGAPRNSLNADRNFSELIIDNTLNPTVLASLAAQPVVSKERRNQVIQARLAEIDILYFEYERQISKDIRSGDFAFSLLGIFSGTAGALASSTASQNWSAFSGLLEGGKAAYDRDVLLDQSLQAFVSQMRANRAVVKAQIVSRYQVSSTNYTLQMALSDLASYQQAGTLAAALAGINQSAQKEKEESEDNLKETEDRVILRTTQAVITPVSRSVIDWIQTAPDAKTRELRLADTISCYDTADKTSLNDPNLPVATFLADSGNFKDVETQVINCLKEKGFNPA